MLPSSKNSKPFNVRYINAKMYKLFSEERIHILKKASKSPLLCYWV